MTPAEIFGLYFGLPDGSVYSNLVASLICVGFAWWRLHRQSARHHLEQLAQAARHHFEQLAQAEDHHKTMKALAEKHHQELLDRADVQHQALAARIAAAAPQRRRTGGDQQ